MKIFKVLLLAFVSTAMMTACGKKEVAKNVEQQEPVASEVSAPTTPEQQAAINAIDKPELQDKKNAEAVSPASEEAIGTDDRAHKDRFPPVLPT